MGDFLKKYGEAIYGTRGGPFLAPDEGKRPAKACGFALPEGNWWGGSTHRRNVIYLHILLWPAGTISLPAIPNRIVRSTLLTGKGKARVQKTASGITVSVAPTHRAPVDTIVKLELDGPASAIAPIRPA